jgi:hypothetical protein
MVKVVTKLWPGSKKRVIYFGTDWSDFQFFFKKYYSFQQNTEYIHEMFSVFQLISSSWMYAASKEFIVSFVHFSVEFVIRS